MNGMMWLVAAWAALSNAPWSTPVTLPFFLSARPATNTHLTFCGWPLKTIWLTGRSSGAKLTARCSITIRSACLPRVSEPILCCMSSASAPPRVAARSTSATVGDWSASRNCGALEANRGAHVVERVGSVVGAAIKPEADAEPGLLNVRIAHDARGEPHVAERLVGHRSVEGFEGLDVAVAQRDAVGGGQGTAPGERTGSLQH